MLQKSISCSPSTTKTYNLIATNHVPLFNSIGTMGHSVSHLYRTWEKGLPPPRSDKDYSDVKQTLWTEIALIAFSQDGMHKTQEMKRHFQPGEEYVHYTIIWGNCVLTWCYFSLALSLKSNDKTPKKTQKPQKCEPRKRTEKTGSTYLLNEEDVKPAPEE